MTRNRFRQYRIGFLLTLVLSFIVSSIGALPSAHARSTIRKSTAGQHASPKAVASYPVHSHLRTRPIAPKALPRPWAVQGEIMGRGGFYSINAEYSPGRDFTFGAGFSYQSLSAMGVTADVITLPAYANYYFGAPSAHRGFATGGVSILSIQGKSQDISVKAHAGEQEANIMLRGMDLVSATLPIPNFGGGYEFAAHSGFLFRAQFLLLYTGQMNQTLGLAVGYRF